MKKLFTLTILGLMLSASSYALPSIMGSLNCCVGNISHVYDSVAAGATWSWSSSNTSVATIDTATGGVTGVAAGTSTITFTSGGSFVTAIFTVNPAPAAIVGPSSVCVGSSITLTDATPGGTWSHSGSAVTVGTGTGIVTGTASGVVTVYYNMSSGCYASTTVSVGASTIGYISGDSLVCAGSSTVLTDATPGGTWSSGSTATATVNPSTGAVYGVAAGIVSISYTATGSCGPVSTYVDVEVMPVGSAGTISGASSIGVGSSTTYSSSVWSGTWSSSNTAVAVVNASTGLVTGMSAGTATITYTATTMCGTYTSTSVITVTAAPPVNRISGHVNFTGAALDTMTLIKVWLITYDSATHMLAAVDSQNTYGSSAYYAFYGKPAADYRVKAAAFPAVFSTTGYIPTYHTSSAYWGTANIVSHTGTIDDGEDITMGYGTVTAGPGFIAGDVTTGANRGTTDGAPVAGVQMYVLSSTGAILQCTYTDAAGHYSFGNLPVGTYTVYPEMLNYATIACSGITLTSSAPTMSTASFVQHTISHKLTPSNVAVSNVKSAASTVTAFPNPTNGKLNIQWQAATTEAAAVTVTDVIGKELYNTTINMTQGTGVNQLDLSQLTNGIYLINIKSGTINYSGKVQVQK